MTGVLTIKRKFGHTDTEHIEKRWPCDDGNRDWSDAVTSKGTLGATRSWRR